MTGNNDADAVYFLRWVRGEFPPEAVAALREKLEAWGGNSAGVDVANIDNRRQRPSGHLLVALHAGNVKERPFSEIWTGDRPDAGAGSSHRPRPLKGRCGACAYKAVCGGNTRVRAPAAHRRSLGRGPGLLS